MESLSLKGVTSDGMYQNIFSVVANSTNCTISSNASVENTEEWDITAVGNNYVLTNKHYLEKTLTCDGSVVKVNAGDTDV